MMGEARAKAMREPLRPGMSFKTDMVPIMLKNVSFAHPGLPLFDHVPISASQGQVVAIVGSHGSGKTTFLELLAGCRYPQKGFVFIPSHLRTLFVSQEPMMPNSSLWDNLTFGCPNPRDVDPALVKSVLQALDTP